MLRPAHLVPPRAWVRMILVDALHVCCTRLQPTDQSDVQQLGVDRIAWLGMVDNQDQ